MIGRSLLEVLLVLSISLVPVASGLAVMVYQQDRKLAENARISLQEAIYTVDLSLDRLHAHVSNVLALSGKPCAEVKPTLIKQVAESQYLRSLTLSQNREVSCSSMAGLPDGAVNFADMQTPLQLLVDSELTPNSLLIYQIRRDDFSATATTYAEQLRDELRGFQDGLTLLLEFGDAYIWDGDTRGLSRPSQSEYFQTAVSEKYGYTVKVGYAQGYSAQEARQSMILVLPSLVLIGIVTGSIIYWAMFRRGPRGGNAVNPR
ncbi:CSS-motif domain-containing protein [Pseudomonas sp. NPDC089395]|uniref:CSS-motif domain-containing protein n=1 Tax=Pseudomonas sp. NPDC089395 TaxID=3364460 RepID=UPI003815C2A4